MVTATLLAAGLIGCGGGSGDTSTGTGGTPDSETGLASGHSTQEPEGPRSGAEGARGAGGDAHFEGSEEQVEKLGSEAGGSERDAVLNAERTYLSALIDGDYARACAVVSRGIAQSLQAMVAPASRPTSCRAILSKLVAGSAVSAAEQQLHGRVVKVRIEGDQGFVIFHAPGARLYAFPMIQEGGGWRVGAINAAVLAPSAATLGEP